MTAAHLHLLLNHFPLVGLAIASLGLLTSILMKNRGAQVLSIALVILTSAIAWPVAVSGENAYKTIRGVADDDGADWLDTHLDRADQTVWLFALPPLIGLLAIFLPFKFPRTATPMAVATLIVAGVSLGAAVYIADAGGKIRHPEIRSTPVPQP